jgi:hypothetical protein
MKKQLIESNNQTTVTDCSVQKCINCVANGGCVYKRSAYEMPREDVQFTNDQMHLGYRSDSLNQSTCHSAI